MKRVAFKMHLNEGQKAEYIKRHNEIWPELKTLLKEARVSEYSIFLDEETNHRGNLFLRLQDQNDQEQINDHEALLKYSPQKNEN